MTKYVCLKRNADKISATIYRAIDADTAPTPLSAKKAMKWIPNNAPAIDNRWQRQRVVSPILWAWNNVQYESRSKTVGQMKTLTRKDIKFEYAQRNVEATLTGLSSALLSEALAHWAVVNGMSTQVDIADYASANITVASGWTVVP